MILLALLLQPCMLFHSPSPPPKKNYLYSGVHNLPSEFVQVYSILTFIWIPFHALHALSQIILHLLNG